MTQHVAHRASDEIARLRTALAEAEWEREFQRNRANSAETYWKKDIESWRQHDIARVERAEAALAAARVVLEAYVADYNNPEQTCHNGYTYEKARAFLERTALQGRRRTEGT